MIHSNCVREVPVFIYTLYNPYRYIYICKIESLIAIRENVTCFVYLEKSTQDKVKCISQHKYNTPVVLNK